MLWDTDAIMGETVVVPVSEVLAGTREERLTERRVPQAARQRPPRRHKRGGGEGCRERGSGVSLLYLLTADTPTHFRVTY